MKKGIFKFFSFSVLIICFTSCLSMPIEQSNSSDGWEEVDRIFLEYDRDFLERAGGLVTTDQDKETALNIFKEYWDNAMLVKISSVVNLDRTFDHELIISRKWVEPGYVSFYIYQLQFSYRNYIIRYEFITDNTVGASNYGNDKRFFNFYKQEIEKFYIDVKSEMKIIANKLLKSDDSLILIQAWTLMAALEVEGQPIFFL